MSQTQLLIEAVDALEGAGVGYLLTGSFASTMQGEPRSTHDIDFWALADDDFDASRFARRVRLDVFDRSICISTPEDTILQKLKWAVASGGSERQVRDAVGVYEMQRGVLDESYLDEWAECLGLGDLLATVRQQATSDDERVE